MSNEKHEGTEHEVPTVQEQREFLALWEKLRPTQKEAIKAFIASMLEK